MKAEISIETVTKTYGRWAPVYDLVFGSVFERARNVAVAATNRVGGRILDVGVGTGMCLPLVRADTPASSASICRSRCWPRHARRSPSRGFAMSKPSRSWTLRT